MELNNNNSNNIYNDKQFFKIWRNIYLVKEIFRHLDIYKKIHKFCESARFAFNAVTIVQYPYREYITTAHIRSNSIKFDPFIDEIHYETGKIKNSTTIISNDIIQPKMIPSSVRKLIIHSNSLIEIGSIPDNIESLVFSNSCKFTNIKTGFEIGLIPSSVKYLEINCKLTSGLPIFLPESIETLKFLWFNSTIKEGQIPDSVCTLSLGVTFNQKLTGNTFGINSKLESLEFGYDYNKQLDVGVLPNQLKTIKFGVSFNQPIIPFSIPPSVKSIIFRGNYTLPFEPNSIPPNVKIIHISSPRDDL